MIDTRACMCLFLSFLLVFQIVFPSISLAVQKKVIAVVDFINTGENRSLDYLQRSIPESMITYLARSGKLEIVERRRLQDALKELNLQMSDVVDEQTAMQVGKAVGATAILVGSYFDVGRNST